jgi:hypothetical protein
VIALEVEALRHRGRDPGRLLEQELDDSEVGDVLVRLVELDAERIGVGVGEIGPRADVLELTTERDRAVIGAEELRRSLRRRGPGEREGGECDRDRGG